MRTVAARLVEVAASVVLSKAAAVARSFMVRERGDQFLKAQNRPDLGWSYIRRPRPWLAHGSPTVRLVIPVSLFISLAETRIACLGKRVSDIVDSGEPCRRQSTSSNEKPHHHPTKWFHAFRRLFEQALLVSRRIMLGGLLSVVVDRHCPQKVAFVHKWAA